MKKITFLLILITIFSKLMGFARDLTLSYFYGASSISDAYLISITIPTLIFGFIGTGIVTGYIPMYNKIVKSEGDSEGAIFTNNLVNVLLTVSIIVIIFGLIFTAPLVKLFASGFDGQTLNMTIIFTRLSLFSIIFTMLVSVYSGFLQIKGNFIIPALIGFPMNFITIIAIMISSKGNLLVLAIGTVVASGSQLFLIYPFLRKKGYKYRLNLSFNDKYINSMIYLAMPLTLGVSVNYINVLIDRTLASRIAIGGISALNYANRLNEFAIGIFVLSITTVLYPTISKMAYENNMEGLKKNLLTAISSINILIIPLTIGLLIFSEQIIKLLFNRGLFDVQAITMTSQALFFYSIGMLGFSLREILSRAFYSLQDTKTPAINAVISLVTNILLNLTLSRIMGINGLALATSISAILATLLLFKSLTKKIGTFDLNKTVIEFYKIFGVSLWMGLISKLTFETMLIIMGQNLALLISVFIGVTTYVVTILFMKIEQVDFLFDMFRTKVLKIREKS